jgi:precorrin-6B methylase 2
MRIHRTALFTLSVITLLPCAAVAQVAAPAPPKTASPDNATPAAPTKEPDVIYVPTPQEVVDRMLEMAEVKKSDVVYDLGCGDGRIVISAAKKYGVKAYGFDIDPKRIKESQENVRLNKMGDLVTIQQKDIFELDLSKADVITLYLLPSLNVRLIPQLEKMKPGSRIVSHAFDMEGVKPDQVVHVGDRVIYKWTTPLKREPKASR